MDAISLLTIFVLSIFVGIEVISKVSAVLHTPLMSLSNAISAIAVVGAILVSGEENASTFQLALGLIAVLAASLNIVSGYLITDRMLKMFRKREPEQK